MPREKRYGSPNMSDTTLLVSVEDLINMAMGPNDANTVNFKMIQTVLHILARQMRMLKTQVEIHISDSPPPTKTKRERGSPPSSESISPRERAKSRDKGTVRKQEKAEKAQTHEKEYKPQKPEKEEKSHKREKEVIDQMDAKEEEKYLKEKEKAAEKEKEKIDKMETKEKEKYLKEKEKAEAKEKEKMDKMDAKQKDKYLKEKEKAEKAEMKEREKINKMDAKVKEKYLKEKEKVEKAEAKEREKIDKMDAKEKEKYLKEKEKAEKAESKEKEKAEKVEAKEKEKLDKMDAKEKEKYLKEKERAEKAEAKEREKIDKMDAREKEKYLKEKEKADKGEAKEKEKIDKMDAKEKEKLLKEKEKAETKEKEKLDKMDAREREKYLKEKAKEEHEKEKHEAKEKERAEREKEKLAKMDAKEREKFLKEKAKEEHEKEKHEAKEKERAEREKEKLAKMDAKEREKFLKEKAKQEHEQEKHDAKERERAEREKEKLDKMDAKERDKYLKEKAKEEHGKEKQDARERERDAREKEKLSKMSAKEQEKFEKEKAKEEKAAKAGIGIRAEKGSTRSDSRTRLGSIEVVTISQFELLEAVVQELKEKAGPLPLPSLPSNEKLRSELARGSASLSDTMQAMQLAARVQAAETAIGRFAGLLTQLTAAGALPPDVASKLEQVKAEMDAITEEDQTSRPRPPTASGPLRKSVAIDPMSKKSSIKAESKPSTAAPRPSITSRASVVSKVSMTGGAGVTHIEMDDAIRSLKDDLNKQVHTMSTRATMAAETAAATAKGVAEKLDIALRLNSRISTLYSLVEDYAEQLSGFDAGITTQLQSFGEQMAQMRGDLKNGLAVLETANNNAETAAVLELTERYDGLVLELDGTMSAHKFLIGIQDQLGLELRSLLESVEMLREQKADRDEVADGLRDKADNSRLAGLLTEAQFALSRIELEMRLECCYDKFRKQEQVWMGAIQDLTHICDGKAEIMQLLAMRDEVQQQLRNIQDKLELLAVILGEPKAAMLTRQLSKGARCGACQVPAIQEPLEPSYAQPARLPARLPPAGEEQPCVPELKLPQAPDEREHACRRWVGGSHTLVTGSARRELAGPLQAPAAPCKRYAGYGNDGRLYLMEEPLIPCVECNILSTDEEPEVPEADLKADPKAELSRPNAANLADGAGDTGVNQAAMEPA